MDKKEKKGKKYKAGKYGKKAKKGKKHKGMIYQLVYQLYRKLIHDFYQPP